MKTSDEMIADLIKRRDEYKALRIQRHRKIVKTALPLLSLCLVLMAGVIVWRLQQERNKQTNETEKKPESAFTTSAEAAARSSREETGHSGEEQPRPNPPDHNNLLGIGGQDYTVTEGSDTLPEGYILLREITEKEANGTELAGCMLYVPESADIDASMTPVSMMEDFWVYQPSAKLTSIAYGGGKPEVKYSSKERPEWIYTRWEPAPPPPERGSLEAGIAN